MSGTGDKIRGKAEELTGKIKGDHQQEAKGKARQIRGEFEDRAEDIKDDAGKKVNDTLGDTRDKLENDNDRNDK